MKGRKGREGEERPRTGGLGNVEREERREARVPEYGSGWSVCLYDLYGSICSG